MTGMLALAAPADRDRGTMVPNHAWWDRAAFGDVGTTPPGSRKACRATNVDYRLR